AIAKALRLRLCPCGTLGLFGARVSGWRACLFLCGGFLCRRRFRFAVGGLFRRAAFLFHRPLFRTRGYQSNGFIQRHRRRIGVPRQRRIHCPVGDIGSVAPFHHLDNGARFRVRSQFLQRLRRARTAAAFFFSFGEQRHRAVDADRERVLGRLERRISALV